MGGCNQSKVGLLPATADEISGGKKKSFSLWKWFKNRRNLIRVAPALPEDQHITAQTERTIQASIRLPSPIPPRSRPGSGTSPTFSEVSLSRHMRVGDDEADDVDMLAIEAAVRPLTPDMAIVGVPLFAKALGKKTELHARQESREILRQLRDAGIVARPESRAGGLSYEYFVGEEFGLLRRPPARLSKLKRARKTREAKGRAQLRQEMESRMLMAEERRQHAIDEVRIKQTKHLVLDVERARDISAQLEEDKIQAAAERLQHKEAVSQVIQGRVSTHRQLRALVQTHRHTEVRLRGALNKLADKE